MFKVFEGWVELKFITREHAVVELPALLDALLNDTKGGRDAF